jgi:hypothetical protein
MRARLERRGRLIARDGLRLAVAVESACAGCGAGCAAALPGAAAVDVRLPRGFSGRIGDHVTLSVSSWGLSVAAALAFGPAIVVLLGSPWITSSMAPADGLLLTGAGLLLALLGGGAAVRNLAARLVRPEVDEIGTVVGRQAGSGKTTEPTDENFVIRDEDVQRER